MVVKKAWAIISGRTNCERGSDAEAGRVCTISKRPSEGIRVQVRNTLG